MGDSIRRSILVDLFEKQREARFKHQRESTGLLLVLSNTLRESIGWPSEDWTLLDRERRSSSEAGDIHPAIVHSPDGYANASVKLMFPKGHGSMVFDIRARSEADGCYRAGIGDDIEADVLGGDTSVLCDRFFDALKRRIPAVFGPWVSKAD